MLKMSSQLENVISAYKTLAKIPSVTGGKLNNTATRISAKWSVRNLDKGKNSTYASSYTLDRDFNVIAESDFGIDVSNEILSAVSPQETFKAVIREEKNGKDPKKQYLEIWSRNTLAHSVDLTSLDKHGDVYADSEFGNLDWSHDETAVVYVAEKKLPKCEPYIKRKDDKPKLDGSGETAPKKGEEFLYRQDWGEQLVGKHLSVIVVFKLPSENLTVLGDLPDDLCPGQVRFSPDGKSVVGVAWATEPRRFGLIFCTNRPSYIFELSLDGVFRKLSGEGLAVRSPRYNFNGDLVWLQRNAGGLHHACHQLMAMRKDSDVATPIVDIVDTEIKVEPGVLFHGIYSQALPSRCFTALGKRLLLSSPQKNEVRSYVVNMDTGNITDISNKSRACSTTILDVRADVILATCSSLTSPGQLYVARLPAVGYEAEITWKRVSSNCEAPATVAGSDVQYLELQHENSQDSVKLFTAIYFAPEVENKKLPLIVWPHGGPHSNFVNAFSLEAALFNMLGFASTRINYRGSIGQGDKNVRSLLSHIGEYDVQDCHLALTTLLKRDERLCERNIFLYGGSYGGLVVAHLAGLYPDRFRAVVMRNPLIDLATKGYYADNSDGCAAEAGFEFTEKGPVSEEQLLAMRRCSPMVHVHKVKAPTAIMLGLGDKRVPYFQGLEYARRLKANGVTTRIYMYDDNHSLSTTPAEMDNLINGALWFLEHIQNATVVTHTASL